MRDALEMGPDDIDFSLDHVDIETDLGDDTPTDPEDWPAGRPAGYQR